MKQKILVLEDRCTVCGQCIEICPRDSFRIVDEKLVFDGTLCHDCGHCISICPNQALTHQYLPKEDFSLISESLPSSSFLSGEQMYFALKAIRSTRAYSKKKVEKAILSKLVDIIRFAPTGHHAQNVELVVVQTEEIIEALKRESAKAIEKFLKFIDNPFLLFFAKLFGKGTQIKKAKQAKPRFTRMLNGFQEGKDYLFHGAPVIFVFHAKKNSTVPADNCNQAAGYVRIVAHAFGLGSCFIGYLIHYAKYNKKIPELLKIPPSNEIFQVLILGYPKYRFKTFVSRKPSKVDFV
ncbi:MAG: nitroreductase family protein [Candidatus Heimdallarchaeota archaeon]|nr:nitroreductase family protein [Candidatus Heimdallarchaeota archaeon]